MVYDALGRHTNLVAVAGELGTTRQRPVTGDGAPTDRSRRTAPRSASSRFDAVVESQYYFRRRQLSTASIVPAKSVGSGGSRPEARRFESQSALEALEMTLAKGNRVGFEDLATNIRSIPDNNQPVKTTLATSDRIIARVTDGIYREPWAAFRELVANAYDADASYVVIETGQPDFHRMTVRDDGIGMSPLTLAYVLKNIGGSSKRTPAGADLRTVSSSAPDFSPGGRPLIGRIGIGLFAVAQLTQHFQIITKASGEGYRLSATVKLRTHEEEKTRQREAEYVAGSVVIVSEKVLDEEKKSQGTSVVLYQLRDEVRRTLQSTKLWDATIVETGGGESVKKPPQFHIGHSFNEISKEPHFPWEDTDSSKKKFDRFFEATGSATGRGVKSANLDHFDEYLRLIWKLSLSLPLDYIGGHPFDLDGLSGLLFLECPDGAKQAEKLDLVPTESLRDRLGLRKTRVGNDKPFSVTLDGIALQRPIRLSHNLMKSSRVGAPVMIAAKQENPFPASTLERAGGRLSFEGYLYWNSKIIPKETAGVLVRIRGASGTLFDPTFLNYQISEQTRLRQITAEIFVHEGLDSAINIDRESFNFSHPHFLYIQKWLHRALRLLTNRLKMLAATDLARVKAALRDQALSYATEVWSRRLGQDADPPFAAPPVKSLPGEVGGADIEWPSETILTGRDKPVGTVRISALAAILEAYGVLSSLPVEDRSRIISDILGIPETDA